MKAELLFGGGGDADVDFFGDLVQRFCSSEPTAGDWEPAIAQRLPLRKKRRNDI